MKVSKFIEQCSLCEAAYMWYIEGSFLQPKLVSKFLVCVPPFFSPFCTYTRPFFLIKVLHYKLPVKGKETAPCIDLY